MRNPKTTIAGYLAIAGAILALLTKLFNGETISLDDIMTIIAAASAGVAGVGARDGSH